MGSIAAGLRALIRHDNYTTWITPMVRIRAAGPDGKPGVGVLAQWRWGRGGGASAVLTGGGGGADTFNMVRLAAEGFRIGGMSPICGMVWPDAMAYCSRRGFRMRSTYAHHCACGRRFAYAATSC